MSKPSSSSFSSSSSSSSSSPPKNVSYRWLTPSQADTDELRSAVPELEKLSVIEREAAIRFWCWRVAVFTGRNNPALTGPDEVIGVRVLRWIRANQKVNAGLGPEISCSTVQHLYIALCAAWGIWARELITVEPQGSDDHSSEFWNGSKWVHVLPHFNATFADANENPFNYKEWSSYVRKGKPDQMHQVSATGGWNPNPAVDYLADWWRTGKFVTQAVTINGNGAYIDGVPGRYVQIWKDTLLKPKHPEFNTGIEPASFADLYPNMNV